MLNELKALFQLPFYKAILLLISSIIFLIFSMEFKEKRRNSISDALYALGILTFIGFLLLVYKILKN